MNLPNVRLGLRGLHSFRGGRGHVVRVPGLGDCLEGFVTFREYGDVASFCGGSLPCMWRCEMLAFVPTFSGSILCILCMLILHFFPRNSSLLGKIMVSWGAGWCEDWRSFAVAWCWFIRLCLETAVQQLWFLQMPLPHFPPHFSHLFTLSRLRLSLCQGEILAGRADCTFAICLTLDARFRELRSHAVSWITIWITLNGSLNGSQHASLWRWMKCPWALCASTRCSHLATKAGDAHHGGGWNMMEQVKPEIGMFALFGSLVALWFLWFMVVFKLRPGAPHNAIEEDSCGCTSLASYNLFLDLFKRWMCKHFGILLPWHCMPCMGCMPWQDVKGSKKLAKFGLLLGTVGPC